MTKGDNPRLCGGTFFVLVLQALKQRVKARQHYKGERDGLSDPEVLIGLIKVINPDYQEPKEGALKGKTNDFKSCKTSTGQYLPFGETLEIEAFDERIRNEYQDALGAMTEFVALFLEIGTKVKKDERLVKALIDLIEQDDSIKQDEGFYIEETHRILAVCGGLIGSACRRNAPEHTLLVFYYIQCIRFIKNHIFTENRESGGFSCFFKIVTIFLQKIGFRAFQMRRKLI